MSAVGFRMRSVAQTGFVHGSSAGSVHHVVIAACLLIGLVGCGKGSPAQVQSGPPRSITSGSWLPMASAPIGDRENEVALWTGKQLVVWSGEDPSHGQRLTDGAAYDPTTDSWRTLAPSPLLGRSYAAAVWSGREVLIWGGRTSATGEDAADGAAYDLGTDRWRLLPA